jgi:hypothetical protein
MPKITNFTLSDRKQNTSKVTMNHELLTINLFNFNLSEFPITITSENAIVNAPIIGFRKPKAARGMAMIL